MRKVVEFTVLDEGRDKGKRFVITEMPASQTESWAMRALFALGKANVEVPDDLAGLGIMGLARLGLRAFVGMRTEDAVPLLDELMQCIRIYPSGRKELVREIIEDDIEEVQTRIKLKAEVFKLHVDFSGAVGDLTSVLAGLGGSTSPSMQTSPELSELSSPVA